MKTSLTPLAETRRSPVFQTAIRKLGVNLKAAAASPNPPQRDKIFSRSQGSRDARRAPPIMTSHNSQTLFRICALL